MPAARVVQLVAEAGGVEDGEGQGHPALLQQDGVVVHLEVRRSD